MPLLYLPTPSWGLGAGSDRDHQAQITAAAPVTVPAVACAACVAVTIRGGSLVSVSETVPRHARYPVIDYGYAVISPGVIDVHVHMNEPGREDWEGEQGKSITYLCWPETGATHCHAHQPVPPLPHHFNQQALRCDNRNLYMPLDHDTWHHTAADAGKQ
jgi:hypothetical protein